MRHIAVLSSVFGLSAALIATQAAATIEGSWSGSGVVNYWGGADSVHCQMRYEKSSAKSYAMSCVCATENDRYELSGRVTSMGGNRYTGSVSSGNESGRVLLFRHGNHLSMRVTSPVGSARLTFSALG
jgi:hypothetical protein